MIAETKRSLKGDRPMTYTIYDRFDKYIETKTYQGWIAWFEDYFFEADPEKDLDIHDIYDLVEFINIQEADVRYELLLIED